MGTAWASKSGPVGADIADEDDPAEGRAGEALNELDAVIAELEEAREGSPALDGRVHFGFRVLADHSPDIAALLISEGISWPTVQAVLDDVIPPYTTSLDAAVDGEKVVLVLKSAKRRCWGAMQRTSWGGEIIGWATTEPLARRLAALKTRRAEMAAAIEEDRKARASRESVEGGQDDPSRDGDVGWNAESAASGPPPSAGTRRETADETEKDWKVLF